MSRSNIYIPFLIPTLFTDTGKINYKLIKDLLACPFFCTDFDVFITTTALELNLRTDKQGNEQGGPRSRQADKMEQIQQFLKDPQNPRGKVEIKVRLKNSGRSPLSMLFSIFFYE